MKKTITLLLLLLFSACGEKSTNKIVNLDYVKIIKEKNFSLSQNEALKYFFYTEGMDRYTDEPNAEAESEYFYDLQNSKESLIIFKNLKKSNILKNTDKYILALLNLDDDSNTLAATFKLDGTPINFLLLSNSFGTNEFSIQRLFQQLGKDTFSIHDKRFDVEWILHPTKGVSKLTHFKDINVTVDKKGYFTLVR